MKLRVKSSLPVLLLALLPLAQNAAACAACFGASNERQAVSMNWGIFSLLAVVLLVLSALAAFFVFLARRAAMFPVPGESDDFSATNPKPAP